MLRFQDAGLDPGAFDQQVEILAPVEEFRVDHRRGPRLRRRQGDAAAAFRPQDLDMAAVAMPPGQFARVIVDDGDDDAARVESSLSALDRPRDCAES